MISEALSDRQIREMEVSAIAKGSEGDRQFSVANLPSPLGLRRPIKALRLLCGKRSQRPTKGPPQFRGTVFVIPSSVRHDNAFRIPIEHLTNRQS